MKRLVRSKKNRWIAGVCAGIGEYYKIDPNLVRALWIIGSLIFGGGIIAYIILWIVIPEK